MRQQLINRTAYVTDISAFLAAGEDPELALERKDPQQWRVYHIPRQTPGTPGAAATWMLVSKGQLLRVPLHPYRSSSSNMEYVLLGAMDVMQDFLQGLPERALETALVLGSPIEDLRPETDGFCFWVGFAARVR